MKEFRITYRSEIFVNAESEEEAMEIIYGLNLDPIDGTDDKVSDYSFVEYVSIENSDGSEYKVLN